MRTIYEAPGMMFCSCGQVMKATENILGIMKTGKVTYECVDSRCKYCDKGFTVDIKKHVIED